MPGDRNTHMKELELYFHIPFCVRKCLYCDFLSAPAGEDIKQRYMEALLTEMAGSALAYRDYRVISVFLGGGTPSTVQAGQIAGLMQEMGKYYSLAGDAEVTIEVNPGTVTEESLAVFRKAGIGRLSIGLQSADDRELAALGRIRSWEQFTDAFAAARKAGFDNINVDVMGALPGQTLESCKNTIEKVLSLADPPEHISAYSLILEEGTPLYERYREGKLELPDEDTERIMYQETGRLLARKGYHRYEISNYAKEGFECRHNTGYWRRKNYLGFGIGAASMVENVRFKNGADLDAYLKHPLECREEIQRLSRQEQMEEFFFLGLRMTEGVSCGEFRRLFGCGPEEIYGNVIRKNICDGLLKLTRGRENLPGESFDDGTWISLTDRGLDLSNYVMQMFLL